jgi:hypothetical protein
MSQQLSGRGVAEGAFVAELVEIHFRDRFGSDDARRRWLDDKLWLQRETITRRERTERFPTWESEFKALENDKFMGAETWYILRNLREIKPLPLPRLLKLADNRPLARNFLRGYALCHYPREEVQIIGGRAAV